MQHNILPINGLVFLLRFILVIGIVVGILLLIREVVTWYWKINKISNLLEEQNELLRDIRERLK